MVTNHLMEGACVVFFTIVTTVLEYVEQTRCLKPRRGTPPKKRESQMDLRAYDQGILYFFERLHEPWLDPVAQAITTLGNPWPMTLSR